MRVKLYNDKWLQSSGTCILTRSAHINLPSIELDAITFTPSNAIPTVNNLHANGDITPFIEPIDEPFPPLLKSADSTSRFFGRKMEKN